MAPPERPGSGREEQIIETIASPLEVKEIAPKPKPTTSPALPGLAELARISVASGKQVVAKMMALKPEPPEPSGHRPSTEREMRLKELLGQLAEEADPHMAQRTQLTIAGYEAGDNDWEAANKIYLELQDSPYVEVRSAALRNLEVTKLNLALAREGDADRREWLQLDLAVLHQTYGHEKAAKAMFRKIQKDSTQDTIRNLAAQRLDNYVLPPLPVLPPQPKDTTR